MANLDWITGIKTDLSPFADTTASGPRIQWTEESGIRLRASWEARGEEYSARFLNDPANGTVSVEFKGDRMSYRSFLAGPHLGDVQNLAQRLRTYHPDSFYVETRAALAEGPTPEPEPVLKAVHNALKKDSRGLTQVVFLTGDAGAGKTVSLKKLVTDHSIAYLSGNVSQTFLYINAQGKALSTFDQALSVELDDLRSRLSYDMIAPLVRNDLIVPIIDGFDELLGSSYDDAFSSLSRFLEILKGSGRLIACARSTYYEQEFLSRVTQSNDENLSWMVDRIQILDWNARERKELVVHRCSSLRVPISNPESVVAGVEAAFHTGKLSELSGKPFFVDRVTDLVLDGKIIETEGDALQSLVDAYLTREAGKKLLNADGEPLLTVDQLQLLLLELANEMWLQESRWLTTGTVRELVELVVDDFGLREQVQEYLHMRGTMLGFLTSAAGGKRIEFEHELMFSYFLALAMIREIKSGLQADDPNTGKRIIQRFLPRGVLPATVPDIVAELIAQDMVSLLGVIRVICSAAGSLDIREDQSRENAGAIIAGMARKLRDLDRFAMHDVTFAGLALENVTFLRCTFARVMFRRTDLSKAKFVGCSASETSFIQVKVDPAITRLDILGVSLSTDVVGLRRFPSEAEVYAPAEIDRLLSECGFPGIQIGVSIGVEHSALEFISRFAQAFESSNLIWPEDPSMGWLGRAQEWPTIRSILLDLGLLAKEMRPLKGGARESLRRHFDPTELIQGVFLRATSENAIGQFWSRMRSLYPES